MGHAVHLLLPNVIPVASLSTQVHPQLHPSPQEIIPIPNSVAAATAVRPFSLNTYH